MLRRVRRAAPAVFVSEEPAAAIPVAASTEWVGLEGSRLYRFLNIVAALVLGVISSPLFVLGVFFVWGRVGRPLFFRQIRTGHHGKLFSMWKLRTMMRNAEPEGRAVWAAENDPRVIPGGTTLRKYRIDELPQVWNILRGDMNLIGPRPERPEFFPHLSTRISNYAERCRVRPGLTGLAQVKCGYTSCQNSASKKHTFDLFYITHRSYGLDLLILFQTIRVVLTGSGAR